MNRLELAQALQDALFAHPQAGPIPVQSSLLTLVMEALRFGEQDKRLTWGRHKHCPDEARRCVFGVEEECPAFNEPSAVSERVPLEGHTETRWKVGARHGYEVTLFFDNLDNMEAFLSLIGRKEEQHG